MVNECLRYNTASALNSRRAAKEDVTIGGKVDLFFCHLYIFILDPTLTYDYGQHIKKGEGVICLVQSADRDETYFKKGIQFDIHHNYKPQDTLGFGYGPHRCIAEWLARAELEVALSEFLFPCTKCELEIDISTS